MSINITVIVPIYNTGKFLNRSLNSLLNQTHKQIEFIFVDDFSSDNSMEILKGMLSLKPELQSNIKIISHTENKGSGAARNTGLSHATGDYIIFCDSDDWIELDLYEQMAMMTVETNSDIVCCNFVMEYLNRKEFVRYSKHHDDRRSLKSMQFDLLYSSLCNKLVKRSLYQDNQIRFYNGVNMWEDVGVMTRLRFHSKKVSVVHMDGYHYNKMNESSIVSVPSLKKIYQQIECAALLSEFFEEHNESYNLVGEYLRFVAKSDLLFNVPVQNASLWRTISMDTHKSIMKFTNLPLNMRLIAFLTAYISTRLGASIVRSKSRLRK